MPLTKVLVLVLVNKKIGTYLQVCLYRYSSQCC